MTQQNVVFGWPRWTPEIAWSGGEWQADWPASNAGVLPLARVARSASLGLAATQIVGTFPRDRIVQLFALVRHNLSVTARYRLRLYADAARSVTLADTGWDDVWPVLFPWPSLEWEDDRWWTGAYAAEDLEGYTWTRPIWLAAPILCRAFLLELADASNPSGYVELGLLEAARGWQPSRNPRYGYKSGIRSRSEMIEAIGGGQYFDRRAAPRIVSAEIPHLPRDEAMAWAFEMQRRQDVAEPMLWLPFPGEPLHWVRECMLARLKPPGPLSFSVYQRQDMAFELEEVL
ncbi:hypothetical protein KTR66_19345 [Roseococcus sp. SDR]|uniref:hypothetical protein n=1 Tax=Roseococcus sp. SDR TaxID=2835532 RepID=UPI001BCAEBD8|nr:hypothetical protein [Roseococcus sp. SDR]MBS7792163.1 hypothetical protein [Roseococcus sp. SDR]MBV1847477.1 hypothetical protein [Roseococcus sp. SDR]